MTSQFLPRGRNGLAWSFPGESLAGGKNWPLHRAGMKAVGNRLVDDVTKLNTTFISKLNDHALIDSAWYFNGAIYGKTTSGKRLTFDIHDDIDAIIAKADGKK